MANLTILDIPDVALEKILSFLPYDEIAINRLVSRQFNIICGGLLTKGFIQLEKKHSHIYKLAKSLLPRRPSERRSNVIVSRYCEILQGMETRIRMLNVTYMRYIEQHFICFIPGKVLDEIHRLLRLIESRFDPPHNNNQLLEELRDLSSMAMEHFDEHIAPRMEKREKAIQYKIIVPSTSKPPPDDEKTQKELRKIHKRNRYLKSQLNYLIAKSRRLSEKWNRQNLRVKKQNSIIKEQNGKLQVQATRLENHEMTILEMKKKFEELQTNFVEIKSKWEMDAMQCSLPTVNVQTKNAFQEAEPSISRNLKIYDSIRQRSSNNKSALMKTRLNPKAKTEDAKRRRFKSMVDIDIWRRKCPTSRASYVSWHRNYLRNNLSKSKMMEKTQSPIQHPSTSKAEKNRKDTSGFVYKTIIKQRPSRVFPLTCLDLERKRKSYVNSEIPTKMCKNEANNTLKALDLLKKYLPGPEEMIQSDITHGDNGNASNILPIKRKRPSLDGET